MKEALFYKKLNNQTVQCTLCPQFCTLKDGETGRCKVRKNKSGKLMSLFYGKPCSLAIDAIEKKPLYHFFPGEKCLSIATVGCNISCKHCQNWEISQTGSLNFKQLSPKEVISEAEKNNIKIIAYTYTEPTIFYEYMEDIAKLAKKKGIKNVIVSNGFINPEPLKKLCKYLDAANIDLKAIDDKFYRKICSAKLTPVLETLKILKKRKIWVEITNLLIPKLNDSTEEIQDLVDWISENLGDTIIHFTAFYPAYKLANISPTSLEKLKEARKIALKKLKYVYTGNLEDEGNNTYCPNCKKLLIKRRLFSIIENNLNKNLCSNCNYKIPGFWSIKN